MSTSLAITVVLTILWLFRAGAATLCLIVLFIFIGRPFDVGQSHFFKDQTYHFRALRLLVAEPYGGSYTEEPLETVQHIRGGEGQGCIKLGMLLPSGLWLLPSGPRTLKAEVELSGGLIPTF
jgi:hypothetical protein